MRAFSSTARLYTTCGRKGIKSIFSITAVRACPERSITPNKARQLDPQAVRRVHDLGYVENFDYFVDDLKTFVEKEAKPANERLFLLAHSMGGAIASLYLEKFNADFSAAALSSPMHQPDLSPIPNKACWLLKLGPGKSTFGAGDPMFPESSVRIAT